MEQESCIQKSPACCKEFPWNVGSWEEGHSSYLVNLVLSALNKLHFIVKPLRYSNIGVWLLYYDWYSFEAKVWVSIYFDVNLYCCFFPKLLLFTIPSEVHPLHWLVIKSLCLLVWELVMKLIHVLRWKKQGTFEELYVPDLYRKGSYLWWVINTMIKVILIDIITCSDISYYPYL